MPSSATDICNLALDLLSSETILNAVTPTTATEDVLARWYDKSRRKVLREHPWNFAIKRAVLAASSTTPAFGYSAQFPVPSDFIRLLTLEGGDGQSIEKSAYAFESNNILYDGTALRIKYIYDHTDVSKMDVLFVDLLVCEIALGIAYKQTGSNSDITRLETLRKAKASQARAIDGQENPPIRVEHSKIMAARRVSSRRTDRFE